MIDTVAETGSTNDDLRRRAEQGAPEGLWLRAERQTGGRGRLGRAWVSPAGNLYASTLIRLRAGDAPAPSLALMAAVALEEAIAVHAPAAPLRIKWPNDLLIAHGGGWAKCAGILLERAGDAVIAGFGVNLAAAPAVPDRATASIAGVTGGAPDAAAVGETLAQSVARWLAIWRGRGVAAVRARWLERAHPIGTPLVARMTDGSAGEGLFEGLDETGALLLRTAERVRTITAGDVFLL